MQVDDNVLRRLRGHQRDFYYLCEQIVNGTYRGKFAGIHVVPGGGKSLLPLIAAVTLVPSVLDKIAWFTPRTSLKKQGAEVFEKDFGRQLFGHAMSLREVKNEANPTGGRVGYVSSHQAIAADARRDRLHVAEFSRYRYGLFLDEAHHIYDGSSNENGFRPLVERAEKVFLLTGSLQRANKRPISWLPYDGNNRVLTVDRRNTEDFYWINYELDDALMEKTIIPITFIQADGSTRWLDETGTEQIRETLSDDSDAIYTALQTQVGKQILAKCTEDWKLFRRKYPKAQLLVVCGSIKQAEDVLKYLRTILRIEAFIATTADDVEADINIDRYREGDISALVTVQKAYEGMDVPGITHLCCLTHIRSFSWLYQMFGRLWRVDPRLPYEAQRGFAYVPDDDLMKEVINTIRAIRDQARLGREQPDDLTTLEPDGSLGNGKDKIIPLSSSITVERSTDISGDAITAEAYAEASAIRQELQLSTSPVEIAKLADYFKRGSYTALPYVEPLTVPPIVTSTSKEKSIRTAINTHLIVYAEQRGIEPKVVNAEVKRKFGQRSDLKDPSVLMSIYQKIQEDYRID